MLIPRCSDPTELGTNFSSLSCPCGGFFNTKTRNLSKETSEQLSQPEVDLARPLEVLSDTAPEVYICSSCSQGADLRGSLAKVDELVKRLDAEGYSKELDDKMEALPGCHLNFHLRFLPLFRRVVPFCQFPSFKIPAALKRQKIHFCSPGSAPISPSSTKSGRQTLILFIPIH